MTTSSIESSAKKSFAKAFSILEPPSNLVQVQLDSFRWFQEEGLAELFAEFSSIEDPTGSVFELRFLDYEFRAKPLQVLMGSVFDRAFRKFADAFEARADEVYGRRRRPHSHPSPPFNSAG